jgi:NitT/TauT family transport system substrate-binding protein
MLLLVGCGGPDRELESYADSLTPIRLTLGYIPNVQFAPVYVAIEKGYFSDAGFDVQVDYISETDAVALLGTGELTFAVVSGEQVLLARSQDIPVVYVAVWYQDYPVGVAAKVESGIQTPEDLVGRQVGLPGLYGANYIGLNALLYAVGVDESEVILDSISYTQTEMLATDHDEAVVIYIANEPVQLRAQGYDINVIKVADYIQLVGNGIVTNEKTLEENPAMVRRFVEAFLRGLTDTLEDPEGAYEICFNFIDGLGELDQDVQKEVLAQSIELWETDWLGYSYIEAWENMQTILLNMGLLTDPLNLKEAFTNQFVE